MLAALQSRCLANRTHNLIHFYKEFKRVPLSKDVPTLTLTQGSYLLWLSFTHLEVLGFEHSSESSATPRTLGKSKVWTRWLCSFPLGLSCKHAIARSIHRLTPRAKQGKSVRREQWNRLSLAARRRCGTDRLSTSVFCQCGTFPAAHPEASGYKRQNCSGCVGSPKPSLAQQARLGSNAFVKNGELTEAVGPKNPTFCPHWEIRGFTLRAVCVLPTERRCSKICCSSLRVTERLSVAPQKDLPQTTKKRDACLSGSLAALGNRYVRFHFLSKNKDSVHFFNFNCWSTDLKNLL